MRIDIDRLPSDGLRVSRDFDFQAEDLVEEGAVCLQPTHTEVTINRIGEEVFIKGKLTARLRFDCSRCLTPFDYPVDATFDLVYLPEELAEVKEELAEEDLDRDCLHDGTLDLRAVILEQLNLTFPLKPLCAQDCGGICPVCGKLRKESGCGCTVREDDPRLSKIKNFIKS